MSYPLIQNITAHFQTSFNNSALAGPTSDIPRFQSEFVKIS
jgi:hypothetical protein